jgi:creatinine amidohydrolase
MTRSALITAALGLALAAPLAAQRPATAPDTGPGGTPPDTVLLEELTWAEARDLVKAGTTTVIIPTAGTEQKGPHMADGEHKFVMAHMANLIARAVGKTLVAPVITYVPEGSWDPPTGHMRYPGSITLPEDRFTELLVHAGRSLKAGGFQTVLFIGESGGNRTGMKAATDRLNELWKGSGARAFWIDDYYTKSHADQNAYITKTMGIPEDKIGGHANLLDTSELLVAAPQHVRKDRLTGNDYEGNGVSGDPAKSSVELGKAFIKIKLDNTVAQIRKVMAGDTAALSTLQAPEGRGPRPGGGTRPAPPAGPFRPTFETAPASKTPTRAPDTVHIDELTWEENRDAIKNGKRVVIVPTGGTEKNGYHMVLGKHNYVVRKGAEEMARKLGNALVAPVIQYVPEGDPDRQVPGAISLPSPAYDQLLDAAARSLRVHGFTDILFIGDSGGNQAGMQKVADALTAEWKDAGVRVYALTDYYTVGRDHYRAYMQAAFGYDDDTVGAHAGISDTSQMLYVHPAGIRKDRIMPWGGPKDAGVSGDPTKATAEIGKMGIAFKVNAGLNQYKRLKNPPPQRTGQGG